VKEQCHECRGEGNILGKERKCNVCNGYGSLKVSLTELTPEGKPKAIGPPCDNCKGTGMTGEPVTCPTCGGSGSAFFCEICHNPTNEKMFLCPDCYKEPVVFALRQPLDFRIIETKHAIIGKVVNSTPEGVIFDLDCGLEAIVPGNKMPRINLDKGQEVPLMVSNPERLRDYLQSNRKNPLEATLLRLQNYTVKPMRRNLKPLTIKRIITGNFDNKIVVLNAEVVSIRQTSGPTTFAFLDEEGSQINGVAFVDAGVRAYPNITEGTVVQVVSRLTAHRGAPQLDIQDISKLSAQEFRSFSDAKNQIINEKAAVDPNFKFLVESDLYEKLKPDLIKSAVRIRYALLTGQPILLKYHHPCVDGAISGVALELAILGLVDKNWEDDTRNILKKIPERDPIYSPQDATRDILTILEEEVRFGYRHPLVILVDFGSSQSQIALELEAKGLNLDVIVIDHHIIEESTNDFLFCHVNPQTYSSEYRISAGMMAVELARMINPNTRFHDSIKHLAAIAGTSDRVSGTEIDQYKKLVTEFYPEEFITEIIHALNYITYNLRFGDGSLIFYDILAVNKRYYRQKQLVPILASKAKLSIDEVVNDAKLNCKTEVDGTKVFVEFDLASFVNYGNFPQPSKIIGNLHDYFVKENPNIPVLTVGVGDSFVIFRFEKQQKSVQEIVATLKKEFPASGISGGGHEFLGSIRFYSGYKQKIMTALKNFLNS
jgi:RecJ-like exonuclease